MSFRAFAANDKSNNATTRCTIAFGGGGGPRMAQVRSNGGRGGSGSLGSVSRLMGHAADNRRLFISVSDNKHPPCRRMPSNANVAAVENMENLVIVCVCLECA